MVSTSNSKEVLFNPFPKQIDFLGAVFPFPCITSFCLVVLSVGQNVCRFGSVDFTFKKFPKANGLWSGIHCKRLSAQQFLPSLKYALNHLFLLTTRIRQTVTFKTVVKSYSLGRITWTIKS